MLNSEQPKYYRFPSKSSLLDYEKDHHIYFPGQEQSFTAESHHHSDFESRMTYQTNHRKEQNYLSM